MQRPTVCRGSQVKLHGRNHGDTVNCIQTFGNRERENTSVLEPSIFRLRTGERRKRRVTFVYISIHLHCIMERESEREREVTSQNFCLHSLVIIIIIIDYQLYNNYADLMYVLMEVNIVEDSITKN